MRRLLLASVAVAIVGVGCRCNDPAPASSSASVNAQALAELRKAAPNGAKCTAFQLVEENGKRRLDCVMARPDAGTP